MVIFYEDFEKINTLEPPILNDKYVCCNQIKIVQVN